MALASVVALVFLLGVTQAQTVDVDGTNVTGIQNLPILDQFGIETIYNVQFVDTTANDLYGPDLDFDFFDADDATLGALTVIATLNDETLVLPTPSGAGSEGSHQFFVGADVQDLGLIGAYGGEFFALGDPPTTLPNK